MLVTLRQKLLSDGDVVAQVGTRVYPLTLPESYILPAITIQQISGERDYSFDTASEGQHRSLTFQVNCCAATYQESTELAAAVIAATSNYQGTFNGVNIRNIQIENENDLDGIEADSIKQTLYVRALDVLFQYMES